MREIKNFTESSWLVKNWKKKKTRQQEFDDDPKRPFIKNREKCIFQ